MKLIVGLGNPGKEYAGNRHNIGFLCLNYFARLNRIEFNKKQSKARVGQGSVSGTSVILSKPQTFMNASGESVKLLVEKYKINLEDLIVIHDELDLPPGKIRIKSGSSAGGHRGAQSIISCLGRQDFIRIRVGIGRPLNGDEDHIINYVLEDFTGEESKIFEEIIPKVSEAIHSILTAGLTATMNKYN